MSDHEEHGVQQESIISKILEKEQELDAAIAAAKVEAVKIVENASLKAEKMITAAKREVLEAEEARRAAEEAAKDSEAVKKRNKELEEKAKVLTSQIQEKVTKNLPESVKFICKEVLPV